jgi:hypothetical protein
MLTRWSGKEWKGNGSYDGVVEEKGHSTRSPKPLWRVMTPTEWLLVGIINYLALLVSQKTQIFLIWDGSSSALYSSHTLRCLRPSSSKLAGSCTSKPIHHMFSASPSTSATNCILSLFLTLFPLEPVADSSLTMRRSGPRPAEQPASKPAVFPSCVISLQDLKSSASLHLHSIIPRLCCYFCTAVRITI